MTAMPAVATTSEADGLLTRYGLDRIAPLFGAYEARTLLDVRALSNLQHGCLRAAGPQRDVMQYCHNLKQLDDTQDATNRLMTEAGGPNWYASRILDLVEEAARTQGIADAAAAMQPTATAAQPAPLTASELANALSGLAGRTASEASKESTTTHEADRLAKVYTIYALRLRESEYGNRRALYLANKYMGPASEHLYPSNDQMPYAALKAASGGAAKAAGDSFEAKVDGDGRVAFTPADPTAVSAINSRQVTQQAKLKIMTLFVELCGEAVPSGYSAGSTGVMPGNKNDRCQVGIDEVWEYCALLDQGAKDVPVKEAWETIFECSEKSLREMTRAPSYYTLGNALKHEITPLTAAITHFKATYQAQKAATATQKRGGATKRDSSDEGVSGANAPNGPNGTYSKRQVSAVLKQIGAPPYGKGKGKTKGKGGGPAGGNAGWYSGGYGDWGYGGGRNSNWGTSTGGGGSGGGKAAHVCRDFQAGRCQRGEQCRFQHQSGADK